MRRVREPKANPADARRWLDHARYIARVAQLAHDDASAHELRRAAEAHRNEPTRSVPARMILKALAAAEEGQFFAPYSGMG